MGIPPESFLIYREELAKARVEKERLQKEHSEMTEELNDHMLEIRGLLQAQKKQLATLHKMAQLLEAQVRDFENLLKSSDDDFAS